MAGPIKISILANANQAISTFNKTGNEAKSLGSRVSSVSGILKTALVGAGIYQGVELLADKFKEANQAVQQQQQIAAQTAAGIKSTGGAAQVSAGQIKALGDALENKSLIDSESIQSGENLLLTFTNIKNEAGKGNDIFNQTTQALADMSTKMGQDTTASAVQLGKALNDPVKGVTALTKVGVSFTDQQREQIKTLVDSGQTMKAQKVILGELNKEFGGSAAAAANTSAGAFFRFKNAVDDVFEGIVRAALPVLADLANYLTDNVPKALAAVQPYVQQFKDAFSSLLDALQPVFDFFKANPVLIQGAAIALGVAAGAALALAGAFAVLSVATSPITLTVLAVAALGAGVAYAYKNSAQFRSIVQQVGQVITGTVLPALKQFGAYVVSTVIPAVVKIAQSVATSLKPTLTQLAQTFQTQIIPSAKRLIALFQQYEPTIRKVVTVVAQLYGKFIVLEAQIVGKVLPVVIKFAGILISLVVANIVRTVTVTATFVSAAIKVGSALVNAGQKAAQFAKAVIQHVTAAVNFVQSIPGKITAALGNVGSLLFNAGASIIQGLIAGIQSKIGAVTSKLHELTNLIPKGKGPPAKDAVLLRPAGQAIIQGLIDGFNDKKPKVTDALKALTARITAQLLAGLSGVTDAVSQNLQTIDSYLADQFSNLGDSTTKAIDSKYDKLDHRLAARYKKTTDAIKKNLTGKAQDTALAKADKANTAASDRLDAQRTKAQNAAARKAAQAQRDTLTNTAAYRTQLAQVVELQKEYADQLDAAQQALASLRDTAAQYADQIRDSVVETGNLVSLGQGDGYADTQGLIDLLKGKVAQAQQYSALIASLTQAGLNQTAIQQLIDAGVSGGIGTAQAILAGGPDAVAQINVLQAQLAATGAQLGQNTADALYSAGIQAAQGLVDGLASQQGALAAQALALGQQIAAGVAAGLAAATPVATKQATKTSKSVNHAGKKEFQIHSPSRVWKGYGTNITQALGLGLDDVYVKRQGTQLARSLTTGFGTPALDAYASSSTSSGAAAAPVQFTVNVPPTADKVAIGKEIQGALDAYYSVGGRAR